MSDALEEFLSRFEAISPASRLRVMDRILAERKSEPDPEVDLDERATKAGISSEQIERFQRAIDEAIAYCAKN